MLTLEEKKVLGYLRQHRSARAEDLVKACGAESWTGWLGQVIARLDWLGYITVFRGPADEPTFLQITERGLVKADGSIRRGTAPALRPRTRTEHGHPR